MTLVQLISWALLIACTAALGYWTIVLVRVVRALRAAPRLPADVGFVPRELAPAPGVSIIIPAHDEQRVIDQCLHSLRAQTHLGIEIIIVCDRCADGTVELVRGHAAADPRVKVIVKETCPPDWAGKCHAAHLGAQQAIGQWLLFTDADVRFGPNLVRDSLALARQRQLDLLSLLGTLTTHHRFERIVQPVASMNLMRLYPLDLINRPGSGRVFANGQFMLFRRECYENIRGHAAVKDDLLEDIAFARLIASSGGRCGVALAGDQLVVSMYDSLDTFRRGWKRIFIEACKRKPARLRKNARRILVNGLLVPMLQLAALIVAFIVGRQGDQTMMILLLAVVIAGWLAQGVVLAWVYRLAGVPARMALFYPIGCWVVGRLILQAAHDLNNRRPIRWGGREYVLEPR